MFTVVFEVHPAEGKKDEYLAHAKELKPLLEAIDGFIDNERYESKRRPGWVLSLSTWRDEKAVVRWRTVGMHHLIQQKGRDGIFSDYRLRVCEVTADTDPPCGMSVVEQRFDQTVVGDAKALAITELTPDLEKAPGPGTNGLTDHLGLDERSESLVEVDVFESIYNPGKLAVLTSWRTAGDAAGWRPNAIDAVAMQRHRLVRTIRHYGMFERREATQYYPDAGVGGHRA